MSDSSQDPPVSQASGRRRLSLEGDEYASALNAFMELLSEYPEFADVRNKAGLSLAMVGRLEEALEQFDAAVEINPTYAEAHLNRAIVLNDLERFDEAREAFTRAAAADQKWGGEVPSELGNRMALAHARLGDLYVEAGKPARAVGEYEEALLLRPMFLDIRSRLAEALLEIGDPGRAGEELEKILESNPTFVSARVRLGVALQRLGDMDGAAREWALAAEQDPGDTRARAYLATLKGD
jgi:tetratricopeptide (TPR) repeat protein